MWAILLIALPTTTTALPAALAHDAGRVPTGPLLVHRFPLKNSGATALSIIGVDAGCGCLLPEVSRREVAVGEAFEVTATVNTLTQPAGRHSWRTIVRWRSAGGEGTTALTLSGEIVPLFTVTPPQVAFSTTGEARQSFAIEQADGQKFRIVGVRTSKFHLVAEAGVDGEGRSTVDLVLKPDSPIGASDEFLVVATDHPACPELRIPVKVLKRSATAVTATPAQPVVRFTAGQTEASTLVQIRSPLGTSLRILDAKADHPALRFRWDREASGPAMNLRIVVESATAGTAVVTVKLANETVTIPVSWTLP